MYNNKLLTSITFIYNNQISLNHLLRFGSILEMTQKGSPCLGQFPTPQLKVNAAVDPPRIHQKTRDVYNKTGFFKKRVILTPYLQRTKIGGQEGFCLSDDHEPRDQPKKQTGSQWGRDKGRYVFKWSESKVLKAGCMCMYCGDTVYSRGIGKDNANRIRTTEIKILLKPLVRSILTELN